MIFCKKENCAKDSDVQFQTPEWEDLLQKKFYTKLLYITINVDN